MQFGRIGWVKIGGKKTNKFEEKALECVMAGYSHNHAGRTHRMFHPQTQNIVNSLNICWADRRGQKSPIAGLKDFNVEGDTEIVDISIEDATCPGYRFGNTCSSCETHSISAF